MAVRKQVHHSKTPQRLPSVAHAGEIAGSNIGARMAPFVGEIAPDPRMASGYAYARRDELAPLRIYREVLQDERCASALDQRLDAAVAKPWEVQPAGPLRRDRMAAESLAAQLRLIGFDRVCRQMLYAVWYGYSVTEVLWQPDAGGVHIAALKVRSPDRFCWSPQGQLLMRSESSPQGEPLPAAKFIVLARPGEHSDLPHGPGLARWCFWPVWLKRNGLKFWSVALEKFGAPTPVAKHRKNADPAEIRKLLELLRDLAAGAGVAMPEDQAIELLDSARRSGGDYHTFIHYLDQTLTTRILGQSSTTDQGPWKGTAEVQKDVRDETVASDCRLLDGALNSTLAAWWTRWNFPGAAAPRIHRDASPPEDLDARAQREEIIARTSGGRFLPTLEHVESVYGGEWEEAPAPAAPSGSGQNSPPIALADADRGQTTTADDIDPRAPDAIAEAADAVEADWQPLMIPVVQPILDAADTAVAEGLALPEFRDRLARAADRMDTDLWPNASTTTPSPPNSPDRPAWRRTDPTWSGSGASPPSCTASTSKPSA